MNYERVYGCQAAGRNAMGVLSQLIRTKCRLPNRERVIQLIRPEAFVNEQPHNQALQSIDLSYAAVDFQPYKQSAEPEMRRIWA